MARILRKGAAGILGHGSGRAGGAGDLVPQLRSVYRWKDKVQHDGEALLLVKTTRDRFDALKTAVLKLHPYELPEVIAMTVDRGHAPYLEWVVESTR
jgi:periplasmic divalent cation tolerance protein